MSAVLKIAIADDEPLARLRLQQLCDDVAVDCPNTLLAQYEHGSQLVNAIPGWVLTGVPDVLLLDINMPGLSGLEIAAYLKHYAPSVAVIFVTAQPEHALTAFELAATDYVLKPVRAQRLLTALKKVQRLRSASTPPPSEHLQLAVHDGAQSVSLPLAQVLYFKSDSKTTLVRTPTGQYTCSQSLTELENTLASSPDLFVRVHRNALLRRSAIGSLSLGLDQGLQVQVLGTDDHLQVSRRMWASLRSEMSPG